MDRNLCSYVVSTTLSKVALRKESVDRNILGEWVLSEGLGRSPQGERG